MKILSIECSSSRGSIAATTGDHLHFSLEFENPRGRGTAFFEALQNAVAQAGEFDLVVVGTGPGSYNSLRASIAAAWGLATARNIPLQGICSLFGYDAPEYFVIGDARAGQWFMGHIVNGKLMRPVDLFSPSEVLLRLAPGIPVFSTSPLMASARIEYPQARFFQRHLDQAGPAEPIYLKPPHITKAAV